VQQALLTAILISTSTDMRKTTFSVVIPTLNESENLRQCLNRIREQHPDVEIIVVDGGSDDETVTIAASENVAVYRSRCGRGTQCNVGAAHASGDVVLFLHADTLLPRNGFEILNQYFENPQVQVGTFRLGFDRPHWILKAYTQCTRFDSLFTTFGDRCIVARSSFFRKCGGFPDWPLFEDVRFLQRARARTKVYCFPGAVTTSARRFVNNGLIRQQAFNAWLLLLFLHGIPPEKLARKYEANLKGPG
jgi:rSAM/selenodomain-associated transferase 2